MGFLDVGAAVRRPRVNWEVCMLLRSNDLLDVA